MQPSLGRIVIAQADPAFNNGSDAAPAIITRVWGDRGDGSWTVNVRIFLDGDETLWKTSWIVFDTEEQAREYGPGGLWWPPRVG
jgi:hypothetical protein